MWSVVLTIVLIVWQKVSLKRGLSMESAPLGQERASMNGQSSVEHSPISYIFNLGKHMSKPPRSDSQGHMVYPGQGSHFQTKSGQMAGRSAVNFVWI